MHLNRTLKLSSNLATNAIGRYTKQKFCNQAICCGKFSLFSRHKCKYNNQKLSAESKLEMSEYWRHATHSQQADTLTIRNRESAATALGWQSETAERIVAKNSSPPSFQESTVAGPLCQCRPPKQHFQMAK